MFFHFILNAWFPPTTISPFNRKTATLRPVSPTGFLKSFPCGIITNSWDYVKKKKKSVPCLIANRNIILSEPGHYIASRLRRSRKVTNLKTTFKN